MNDKANKEYVRNALERFVENMPSMARDVGDPSRIDEFLNRLKEDSISWKGICLHLEVYESSPSDPVLLFHPGMGAYTRFYLCFLSLLSEWGFNIIGIDRPGHGFSEGKRGDCTIGDMFDFMPMLIEKATTEYNNNIGMFGSSMGGGLTFLLLPELTGVRSALCHNWTYPEEPAEFGHRLGHSVARFINIFTPQWSIPMKLILNKKMISAISETPYMVDYFRNPKEDPVMCQSLSLRSLVSFMDYRPPRPYSELTIPVMGLIGENEGILPLDMSTAMWQKAALPNGEMHVVKGAHHLLFHDNIAECTQIVADWFHKTLV